METNKTKSRTNYEALKKLAGAFKEDMDYWKNVKIEIYKNRQKCI